MHGAEDRRGSSWRIVARDVGSLQVILSFVMLASLALSLAYREYHVAVAFGLSAAAAAGAGTWTSRAFRDAGEAQRRHAMSVAGAGWLVTALFGSLPFLLAAWITPPEVAQEFVPEGEGYVSSLFHFRNPLHALFESLSGFSTTGLSIAVHEPSLGHGLLFYRSLTQWIGGVGVIVLALAVIPRPHDVGGLELYRSEASGTKMRPSILGTARVIWKIYASLTLLVALYLFLALLVIAPERGVERSLFEAVNHTLSGLSTGGFSPLDDGIATYRSPVLELVHLLPMILGAVSIPTYYAFLRARDPRAFWRDAQFRTMAFLFLFGIPLLVLLLQGTSAVPDPVREGAFQFVSALSGTGWQTSDVGGWRDSAALVAAAVMVVGGAAGSTAGGLKLIRVHLLSRAVAWRVRKVFLPGDAVVPFRLGDRSLSVQAMQREVADASVLALLFLVILGASVVAVASLVGPEFTLADVIVECASAQCTVGLTSGITGPDMPVAVELVLIFQMWVGRLEIFPVIVLLSAVLSSRERR